MDIYQNLQALGIELSEPAHPGGIYTPVVVLDSRMVYVSGNGCAVNGQLLLKGKVGREISLEQAQEAAKASAINILKNLQKSIGDLNRIRRVVKMLAFVASDSEFYQQAVVANAASTLFAQVFGDENGKGVRSAIGVCALPGNMPVEIEMVFELKP